MESRKESGVGVKSPDKSKASKKKLGWSDLRDEYEIKKEEDKIQVSRFTDGHYKNIKPKPRKMRKNLTIVNEKSYEET